MASETYISCNEVGDREVRFEFDRTLFDRILRRPGRTLVFVQPVKAHTSWYYKNTGELASSNWCLDCLEVVERHRQRVARKQRSV